jgi:type VI secretion system protein ImpG
MFSKYYEAELDYLRQLGRQFAAAHPESAGLLAERGGDPDVERLLEGFAFLTARLRERVDDAVPEVGLQLLDLLLPHYARTIPACSIVEFQPLVVRGRQRIERGTEVASIPISTAEHSDGVDAVSTRCRFRTTMDVDLLPLALDAVASDGIGGRAPTIRASFRVSAHAYQAVFAPEGLRLHVDGEPGAASTLFLWFARHLEDVVVSGASGKTPPVRIGRSSVRLTGLTTMNPLVPWPRVSPMAYQRLYELFVLPAKFLFFDVVGLDRASAAAEEAFHITFEFCRPPELPARPERSSLRLYCTPVVNLFATSADPVTRTPERGEHLLRAAELPPQHAEIFSVDQVLGALAAQGERRLYRPLSEYGRTVNGTPAPYYRVRRATSVLDDGLDTYLSIVAPRDAAPLDRTEVLSIDLTCTNRSLPARLRTGEICEATASSPLTARFRNIRGVSRPTRPPLGSEIPWRLLSHLRRSQQSLASADGLRELLGLYNFAELADEQVGRANALRIEGIRAVAEQPITRLLSLSPVRGSQISVQLDERNYASRGDAFLFGAALDELFAEHVSINAFTELVVTLEPSLAEYRWTPRSGSRPIV